ncbi:MAG: ATP-dependent Clp protease adaptor ClpS [Gemmataceae bacterium]|nr:ATP-dependent Clp protease adaptor ClpS [Gemmataceae bacterium]
MTMSGITSTQPVLEPTEEVQRPKYRAYNVILLNDDDHTFDYVIRMLKQLFGYPEEKGFLMALEVHETGRVIVCTTTLEHAELKRDQIHAFGPDPLLPRSKGSMSATIEPVED